MEPEEVESVEPDIEEVEGEHRADQEFVGPHEKDPPDVEDVQGQVEGVGEEYQTELEQPEEESYREVPRTLVPLRRQPRPRDSRG